MSSEKLNLEPRVSESDSHSVMAADIRSTDGKYHRVVFDRSKQLLQFTLAGGNVKQPNCMVKDINELLSVRGTPVIMRRGLPVDLNKSAKQADTPNSLFLYFAEQRDKCKWRIREVVAIFTTSSEKKHWLDSLNSALKELEQRPKTLLIFVNPYGGKGKAKKVYAQRVELILAMADVKCEVVMTQRANHAFDELKQLVDSKWNTIDGVVSVGGDGLFNECLSAIVCRSQEEAHKDITDINIDALETPRMRFGIIGAGSANSIVSSVHGTDDCPTAAIHIAMGSQCPVDVCLVHRGDDLMRISANAISYGWLGDVLADSERYRWMGPFRYQFSALRTTARNPSYFGRVSFCLINEGDQKEPVVFPKCAEGCTICESGSKRDGPYSHHVQTDFTHVIGCVIPCVSPFTPYGLAPYAGVGDGSMDLAIVPRISRCANMRFMRKVAMHGGKSVLTMSNTLNVFRVTRWAFTPAALLHSQGGLKNSPIIHDNQGSWNLDGEILPQPPDATLHFRLHPRLIKYFGRELHLNQPKKKRGRCYSKNKRLSNIVTVIVP